MSRGGARLVDRAGLTMGEMVANSSVCQASYPGIAGPAGEQSLGIAQVAQAVDQMDK